ncbi:MAG: hypothetical protein Q9191_000323 [Dirinaria sp. TL-2023a]
MAFRRPIAACFIRSSLLFLLLSTVFPHSSLAQSTTAGSNPVTRASPATPTPLAASTLSTGASATSTRASHGGLSSPVPSDRYASEFSLPTNIRSSSGGFLLPTDLDSSPTPSSRPSNDDDDDGDGDDDDSPSGVLNYYFLLIAIFIIIVITAYCCISRRRRRKITQLRNNRQDALAQDLESWSGTRRWIIAGRWRTAAPEPRVEEGLNERGEAPPPYMPQMPEPSHTTGAGRTSDGIELRDVRKPPEYEAGTFSSKPEERGTSGERMTEDDLNGRR